MSLFFINYGREPRFGIEDRDFLPIEAIVNTSKIVKLYKQLQQDITFLNLKIVAHANTKRTAGPIYKKGDKVYLQRRNVKTKRPSKKLDFLKLRAFEVEEAKGLVN